MPSKVLKPNESIFFPHRQKSPFIEVRKIDEESNAAVSIINNNEKSMATRKIQHNHGSQKIKLEADTAFEIKNTGDANIEVGWPDKIFSTGIVDQSELEQVISNLPWGDAFELGSGVDAITGGIAGRAVKEFTPTKPASQQINEHYRFISSETEYFSEVEASASGKYNIEGVTVSAATSYLKNIQFSESSITLIAEYDSHTVDYAETDIYELTEAAKSLVSTPEDFRKAYGDFFISGVKQMSRFIAIYVCCCKTAKSLDDFKASFGGSAPEVFAAEGSLRFQQAASEHHVDVTFKLFMLGTDKTPPPSSNPWSPEEILKVLAWFKEHQRGVYLKTKLKHYSTIAPTYPRTIDVSPTDFSELRLLYLLTWDVRAHYDALPANYQAQAALDFRALDVGIETHKNLLVSDPALRLEYMDRAKSLLYQFKAILTRRDFYHKVQGLIHSEPPKGSANQDDDGPTWMYGINAFSRSDAVNIQEERKTYHAEWHIGWREKTLEFGPDDRYLIVGWKVVANWADGQNGEWTKKSDQILLSSHGAVHVKSDYDRGCNWSVVFYYVDAEDYQFD